MDGLRQRLDSSTTEIELDTVSDGLLAALRELPFVVAVERRERVLTVQTQGREDRRPVLARLLAARGCLTLGMHRKEPTLEEAFVTITEKNLSTLRGDGARDADKP
jgi:hypothetical protein